MTHNRFGIMRFKMTKYLLLSALLALGLGAGGSLVRSQNAPTAEWKPVSANEDFFYLFNPKNVSRSSKDTVFAWTKAQAKAEARDKLRAKYIQYLGSRGIQIEGYKNFAYALILKEFNCAERKSRLISVKDYDEKGHMLSSTHIEEREQVWTAVAPETVEAELLTAVCQIGS